MRPSPTSSLRASAVCARRPESAVAFALRREAGRGLTRICQTFTVARAGTPKVAYEVVAGRLRRMILDGRRSADRRLPTEAELCEKFGVSRSTVREALRMLASQGLVTTSRGVGGGSRIAHLRHQDVGDMLKVSLTLLARSDGCSVAELLEAREFLEIPAARVAAARRGPEHLEALRASLRRPSERPDARRAFDLNRSFHGAILDATGNRLLNVMTEPLFTILQTRFLRDRATPRFWGAVRSQHAAILRAVEAGDGVAAGDAMASHLARLRTTYERIDAMAVGPATATAKVS